jgi:hypothetical protein
VAGGELDRWRSAGVAPVGGDVFDPSAASVSASASAKSLMLGFGIASLSDRPNPGVSNARQVKRSPKTGSKGRITLAEQGEACSIASAGPLPARR